MPIDRRQCPPGLHAESSELFGFFTYKLRVGHAQIWSTAQGRFGRPLRTTGVQHPAPTLLCNCYRDEVELPVEAPHAMAVLNGKNITADLPRTDIWALLYAQVVYADGKDYRNILLDERKLSDIPRKYEELLTPEGDLVLAKGNRNSLCGLPRRGWTPISKNCWKCLGSLWTPRSASCTLS